jgi:hypothetical protein
MEPDPGQAAYGAISFIIANRHEETLRKRGILLSKMTSESP